jgi:hypothetical protein
VLVSAASFPGLASNNVGEPGAHADFVDFLPMYSPHRIWTDQDANPDCFVFIEHFTSHPECGTNVTKFDGKDGSIPPAVGLCSIPTFATGFVYSGNPTGSGPAASSYSANSSGGTNTITQTGTGSYRVDFPGLGLERGGNVQVTAYGAGPERCKVESWWASNGNLSASVACFDAAGERVNTRFTASYLKRGAPNPSKPGGYLWADEASSSSYTASPMYQWNSSGALNTVERFGIGTYWATFPGISVNGGTVEVTSYGHDNTHCKTLGWGSNGVYVGCFTPAGAPVDSQFTLNFAEESPHDTHSYAYAWADQPSAESYIPSTWYQRNFRTCASGAPLEIRRTATGRYSATIPGLTAMGSTVHVTAYSATSESCKVVGWSSGSGGTQVNVACHGADGIPADALFVLTYSSLDYQLC